MCRKKTAPTGRAVGYVRVSTDHQEESGLGLEAQREAIRAHCQRAGLRLGAILEDAGVSGAKDIDKRPGLAAAIAALGPGDALVVAKRDRLARSQFLMQLLERDLGLRGCRIVSAAGEGTDIDGPMADVFRQILDAFAQFERAQAVFRTAKALAVKRARGEKTGGHVPYGYAVQEVGGCRVLAACDKESLRLRIMRALRREGCSYREVAGFAEEAGWPTRTGARWSHVVVRRILERAGPGGKEAP